MRVRRILYRKIKRFVVFVRYDPARILRTFRVCIDHKINGLLTEHGFALSLAGVFQPQYIAAAKRRQHHSRQKQQRGYFQYNTFHTHLRYKYILNIRLCQYFCAYYYVEIIDNMLDIAAAL